MYIYKHKKYKYIIDHAQHAYDKINNHYKLIYWVFLKKKINVDKQPMRRGGMTNTSLKWKLIQSLIIKYR